MARENGEVGDAIDLNFDTVQGGEVTWSLWLKKNSNGIGSSNGHVFSNEAVSEALQIPNTDELRYFRTGGNNWRWETENIMTAGDVFHFAVTYDGGSSDNDPRMWLTLSGNSANENTVTQIGTPSGSIVTTASNYVLMNDLPSGGGKTFDGWVAEVARWNRILTDTEVEALAEGASPSFFPASMEFYLPLVRDIYDVVGNTSPADMGTAVAVHDVPIRYPGSVYAIGASAPAGSLFFQSVAGAFTPAGGLVRQGQKPVAGNLTSSGNVDKQGQKQLSGSFTPVGGLVRNISKSVAGMVASAGGLVKETLTTLTGVLTPSGAVASIKLFVQAVAGGLTFAGSMTKETQKSVVGALTATGTVTKNILRRVFGVLSPSGDVGKSIRLTLVGVLSSAGVVATIRVATLLLTGSLTFAGDVAKQTQVRVSGILSPSGALARLISTTLRGTITFAGAVAKQTQTILAGVLTTAGSLVTEAGTAFFQAVGGTLSPNGELVRHTQKWVGGSLSTTGDQTRLIARTLVGGLSFMGNATKRMFVDLAGTLNFTSTVSAATVVFVLMGRVTVNLITQVTKSIKSRIQGDV